MSQPLFSAADAASDISAKLIPAPISDGTTVSGFSGLMLCETRGLKCEPIVSVGVVATDGSVVGVLLDDRRFDKFCLELAPLVERARQRADAASSWAGATVQ